MYASIPYAQAINSKNLAKNCACVDSGSNMMFTDVFSTLYSDMLREMGTQLQRERNNHVKFPLVHKMRVLYGHLRYSVTHVHTVYTHTKHHSISENKVNCSRANVSRRYALYECVIFVFAIAVWILSLIINLMSMSVCNAVQCSLSVGINAPSIESLANV